MKRIPRLSAIVLVAAGSLTLAGCVEVEEPGRAPTVDIDPGEAPEVETHVPDVDVRSEERDVTVPDVNVDIDTEKTKMRVPDVDVTVDPD